MQITLKYSDKSYEVDGDRAWGLVESVESVITLFELHPLVQAGTPPMARVFRAYAAALRVAGAGAVSVDELRKSSDMTRVGQMAGELLGILLLAMPDIDFEVSGETDESEAAKKKD